MTLVSPCLHDARRISRRGVLESPLVNYAPGLLLTNRYRLEELIAEGGMGQIWRALDETLQRPVAVKVLRQGRQ